MKLSHLALVTREAEELRRIADALNAIENGLVDIVVAGKYQDDAMKELIKPVLVGELQARRAAIHRDLEAQGVDID